MKIIVDKIPFTSKECIFSELINMTGRRKCMFRQGMYSRCYLESGEKCPYLKKKNQGGN